MLGADSLDDFYTVLVFLQISVHIAIHRCRRWTKNDNHVFVKRTKIAQTYVKLCNREDT